MDDNTEKAVEEVFGIGAEELEKALNDMLPGLANHVRDVNLEPEIAALYRPGMVIRDKAFVDATKRIGGMATTHRFAIFSNHMADLSEFEHGTNWGLCVAAPESRFKVIDVYEHEGKTQISLLHLLDDDRWHIFANAEFKMPGLNIEDIRSRFEMRCSQEPIPELATKEWLDRCSYPVGLNPSGGLYAPDPLPAEALWRVGDTGFRRFMGNVVFLAKGLNDEGGWLAAVPETIESGGVFAWPYIDQECGLSFRYLCPAAIEKDRWISFERDESVLVTFRLGSLENAVWCPTGIDPHDFEKLTFETDKAYEPDSSATFKLREAEFLDPIRHPLYPDDVQALLLKDGMPAELVWLHLCDLRNDSIFGRLLNEPEQEFGVHVGDVLPLAFREDEERGIEAAVLVDGLEA